MRLAERQEEVEKKIAFTQRDMYLFFNVEGSPCPSLLVRWLFDGVPISYASKNNSSVVPYGSGRPYEHPKAIDDRMSKTVIEEKTFKKINFSERGLAKGDYENCTFVNCVFSNIDLSNNNFLECEFNGCNLSMSEMAKTAFRNIKFKECKLLGLHFENCNKFLFSVEFENCVLNLSSFYKLGIKKTKYINCSLQEVDFTECDLSGSIFDNCDLMRARFERTVLEKVDFRTAYNYSIDPELNRIKNAKFSIVGIIGLLDKYDIEVE